MFSVKIAPATVDHSLVRGKFLVVTVVVRVFPEPKCISLEQSIRHLNYKATSIAENPKQATPILAEYIDLARAKREALDNCYCCSKKNKIL